MDYQKSVFLALNRRLALMVILFLFIENNSEFDWLRAVEKNRDNRSVVAQIWSYDIAIEYEITYTTL